MMHALLELKSKRKLFPKQKQNKNENWHNRTEIDNHNWNKLEFLNENETALYYIEPVA